MIDTEVLFALSPTDRKHEKALKALKIKGLKIPDTVLLEFQVVLRSRGVLVGSCCEGS